MRTPVAFTPQLRSAGRRLVIASVIAIAAATLWPQAGTATEDHLCIICGDVGGVDAVLNVLLFMPLGAGLALWGIGATRAIACMSALTVSVETAQLLIIPGRDAVLGDVLTNVVGGVLGYVIGRTLYDWLAPDARTATRLTFGWAALWLGAQAVASVAFVPAMTGSPYYGQIAHSFPHLETFHGHVLSFTVDTMSIPDRRMVDWSRVSASLDAHAIAQASATISDPTPDLAPIVGIMDKREQLILVMGQRRESMVFAVRTVAAVLHLRPPLFQLPDAFRDGGSRVDTLPYLLAARYGPRAVSLRAETERATVSQRIALSPAFGWALLFPMPWYISGDALDVAFSCAWTALLLLPLGYWGWHAGRGTTTVRAMTLTVAIFAFCGVGLIIVPLMVGISSAGVSTVLAALTGLAIGCALARLGSHRASTERSRDCYTMQ